ncbi:MAG: tRNA pseudouridine(55) synthase TruB [Roseburia sp.]|nr:tRNA pseudouridine(55) synthase TruB [Anaeroplasma bactoclasticum]MCM1197166.1 tRNA pseudouridine(55) synthase TruB [Roseburia sp.]MCM1557794.1 tRNA pseudouridine(55) synthase TruB [Anaeroplasma bactoclasticum]
MDGFFVIDKPTGITSQGVVASIKRQFNLKKCGHTGTLDPDATGVLVIACGEATKLIRLLDEKDKEYETTIIFGYDSNTLDFYGKITKEEEMNFTLAELESALNKIKHQALQIPPMVSAIKVNGKKLYEYERENKAVELVPRKIQIKRLERISDLRWVNGHLEVDVCILCSKGFYVRSFARDLGQALGGCAILKNLRRLKSGRFSIENAVRLEDLKEENLYSIEAIFSEFSYLEVNDYIAKLVKNGVMLDERQIITKEPFYITHNGVIISIYEVVGENKYKPVVIFKGN